MRRPRITLALLALSTALLAGCAGESGGGDAADPSAACAYPASGTAAVEVDAPPAEPTGETAVVLQTSAGDIPIALEADAAPCTVNSFASLASQGYFDATSCHRLTTAGIFVLQCGDPTGTGRGGPGYRFADELDGAETYPAGTVAMANAGADTNGSQFFLVYEDTELPPSYTVFGQMDDAGLEVVRGVAAAGVEGDAADGAPASPVTIESVSLG